jgi:hypothetical protein
MKKTKQNCLYFFIDFKKAYDTIPPFLVLQQLRKNNIDEQSILIIEDLMKGNTTTFEWNDISIKQEVKLERGVRQGSVLSPILFNLAINELLIEILKICLILTYADDIVIACKSKKEVHKIIKTLENFCNLSKMEISIEKSAMQTIKTKQNSKSLEKNYLNQKNTLI